MTNASISRPSKLRKVKASVSATFFAPSRSLFKLVSALSAPSPPGRRVYNSAGPAGLEIAATTRPSFPIVNAPTVPRASSAGPMRSAVPPAVGRR